MRVVVQRVTSARVTVGDRVVGRIDRGLMVLVGIETADTAEDGQWLAEKIAKLRIFEDAEGKMNLSLLDLATAESTSSPGATRSDQPRRDPQGNGRPLVLVVSQFTLHASTAKGTRPSYNAAARPDHARPLYEQFVAQVAGTVGRPTQTGEFGAMMQVALVNEGPVTLILDSKRRD